MILAVDAGNTNIVAALMEDEKVISTKRFATGKDQSDKYHYEELLKLVNECCAATDKSVQGSIISSVVPCINKRIETACEKITGKSPLIVDNTINTGMTICYDNPSKLGADLICDGAGAVKKYGAPVVVIDIGTATTFLIIDETKKYLGSVITPGPITAINALTQMASLLPDGEFMPTDSIIGKNTYECMSIGTYTTHSAMIDGMIQRFEEKLGDKVKYIITGGPAKDVVKLCKKNLIFDDDLLHYGLYTLYELNKREDDV